MVRQRLSPENLADADQSGYSQAIIADGTFYMSGQVGVDADFTVVGDDFESQARQAFRNVNVLLNEIGKSFDDVVKVKSHIVDLDVHKDTYMDIWDELFSDIRPCHTLLGVDKLANEAYRIEVEVQVPVSSQ